MRTPRLLALLLLTALAGCTGPPKTPAQQIATFVAFEQKNAFLIHTGITFAVSEYIQRHPTHRAVIANVSLQLKDDLTFVATADIGQLLSVARTKLIHLHLPALEHDIFDAFLVVLVPVVHDLARQYAPQGTPLEVEQQVLLWIHTAAILAPERSERLR